MSEVQKTIFNGKDVNKDPEQAIKYIMINNNITLKDTKANLIKANVAHCENGFILGSLPVVEPTEEELKKIREEQQKRIEEWEKQAGLWGQLRQFFKDSMRNDPKYFMSELKQRFNFGIKEFRELYSQIQQQDVPIKELGIGKLLFLILRRIWKLVTLQNLLKRRNCSYETRKRQQVCYQ